MKILFITLSISCLYSQDSLFWFDMNKLRDPVPITPKVIDAIYGTSQLHILDSLQNIRKKTKTGFRIQIYETSSVEEANRALINFKKTIEDSLYIIFEAPLYRIHYGNFDNKNEAEKFKKILIRKGYKNIWVVRSRIENKNSLKRDS